MQGTSGLGGFPASGGGGVSDLEQYISAAFSIGMSESKIDALQRIQSPEIPVKRQLEILCRALHDIDPEVNILAAQILIKYGTSARELRGALTVMMSDTDYSVAVAAFDAVQAMA